MNKSALKKFATEARKELLERVEFQARKIGITADSIQKATIESSDAVFIDGKQLLDVERRQRNKLIQRIEEIGFTRVIEETAYTWFNRFIALRFMEVNDYLPTKVRVLSSYNPANTEPDMMKEVLSLDLEMDKNYVQELKLNNQTDELFKYLIKLHCNDLNRYMPFMFETIEDYKEILFPERLLDEGTFVRKMTNPHVIAESDWESVEIIGWLYQYYISEENERVIKAKKRYKAEELPFATQLFTPEWIVRYMVQNALGRYWIESHPEHRDLISNWEFYLENPNPEPDFEKKLAPYINRELNVENIKCFDPAMGSGHILVYMFDVLFEIYSKCGYIEREIPRLIIEKNLYGLDIDDRAYQLANFSIVMKALQYNKRFLRSIERDGLTMNLASIQETNILTDGEVSFLAGESSGEYYEKMKAFIDQFNHAKAIGSLIKLGEYDKHFLQNRLTAIKELSGDLFELEMKERILSLFENLINQASLMEMKYDVFITNPPYAGSKYLTPEVSAYLNTYYPDVKSDLFSSFIEYSFNATKENGQMGFMTPFVWMFISSYEKLRQEIINDRTISSLIQLEYSGFDGATVPICTFTLRNYCSNTNGEYVRLSDFRGAENQPLKTLEAVKNPPVSYRYSIKQENFNKIPGTPIAYWVSESMLNTFWNSPLLEEKVTPMQGFYSGDNDKFLRYWYEINSERFTIKNPKASKWYPYNKGGEFRKWYGNNFYVIDWENDGYEIRHYKDERGKLKSRPQNIDRMLKSGITWGLISSGKPSFRYFDENYLSGHKGPFIPFEKNNMDELYWLLGILNSKFAEEALKILSPTIGFEVGQIKKIPYKTQLGIKEEFVNLVKENINFSREEWDNSEISWDFKKNALLKFKSKTIRESYSDYQKSHTINLNNLRRNEVCINFLTYQLYEISENNDFNSESEKIETLTKYSAIKDFISYFIGNLFGRYSLDEDGLVYAGGEFNALRYRIFRVCDGNILPILPDAYFEDDIVTRFVDFVRVTFSEETLEENLDFIADAIGRKKSETAREAVRRYFLNDFFKDHVQTYKKRPIYWLFTSGKEKAFNCLIYMHRYDETTLSRIRTDYLHEVQIRMDAEKKELLSIIEGDYPVKEVTQAKKELTALDKKIDELKAYDELLHHMADRKITIDLDDGVKHNYDLFEGLVAKI